MKKTLPENYMVNELKNGSAFFRNNTDDGKGLSQQISQIQNEDVPHTQENKQSGVVGDLVKVDDQNLSNPKASQSNKVETFAVPTVGNQRNNDQAEEQESTENRIHRTIYLTRSQDRMLRLLQFQINDKVKVSLSDIAGMGVELARSAMDKIQMTEDMKFEDVKRIVFKRIEDNLGNCGRENEL